MPALPMGPDGKAIYPSNTSSPEAVPTPINNPSSSTKDNEKNKDNDDPKRVLGRTADEISYIQVYAGADVSAYIYFRMFEYKRGRQSGKVEDGTPVANSGYGDKTNYKSSIVLPLTQPINMAYQVNWDSFDSPLNGKNVASLATDAVKAATAPFIGTRGGVGGNTFSKILSGAADVASNETVVDYGLNVAANESGKIFNMDSELVLQGIGLRKHTFEFMLTPRNQKESIMILKAINEFKKAATPGKAAMGAMLSYPYEFTIYFMDGRPGREGQALKIPAIPDCACININVTYNPQLVKFNEDQTVIQYRITLQFVEHQTLTREDLQDGAF